MTDRELTLMQSQVDVLATFLGLTPTFSDTRCGSRPLYQRNSEECAACSMFCECEARAEALARLMAINKQLQDLRFNTITHEGR